MLDDGYVPSTIMDLVDDLDLELANGEDEDVPEVNNKDLESSILNPSSFL